MTDRVRAVQLDAAVSFRDALLLALYERNGELPESPRRVRRLHVDRNYATPSLLKPL